MPLPTVTLTAFLVYGSDENSPFVNVLHYFQMGTFDADDDEATAMAGYVDGTIAPNLIGVLAADCRYFRSFVRISNDGVVFEAENTNSAAQGDIAGQSLPDYAAAIIRKRTAVGGKTGRGRWYVGCVAEAFQDTGFLTPAALTAYQALAANLIINPSPGGGTWIAAHLSRKDNTLVGLTDCRAIAQLGTLRRRMFRAAF